MTLTSDIYGGDKQAFLEVASSSHLGHFLHGPGFNSTFPLTINNIPTIQAYTSKHRVVS